MASTHARSPRQRVPTSDRRTSFRFISLSANPSHQEATMGYGDYSHAAHAAIANARASLPLQDVFRQTACHPLMNPHGVTFRESRDSPDHPRSLGIAFALDVTGSMGAIPELLARRELPNFMKTLEACGVPDPQVLFL